MGFKVDKIKFNKLLEDANLNKKELANLLGCAIQTVNNWGSTQNIPYWVESWLENYIKAKTYKDIKDKVFEIEGVESHK